MTKYQTILSMALILLTAFFASTAFVGITEILREKIKNRSLFCGICTINVSLTFAYIFASMYLIARYMF